MSTFLKILTLAIFSIFLILLSTIYWNSLQIRPSEKEVSLLKDFYGDIDIQDSTDIIRIQHYTLDHIAQENMGSDNVRVESILKNKKGQCYDRSLILQKIMSYNGFEIKPVYLFNRFNDPRNTKYFDILKKDTQSHNIFLFKLNNRWVVMRTNHKMSNFESLERYLSSHISMQEGALYIPHLNNRNGKFIPPNWLPDIY